MPYQAIQEKQVQLEELRKNPLAVLKGKVRIFDSEGKPFGIFLSTETLEEIAEEQLASDPEFVSLLDESRASGRISGPAVKHALGIA